MISGKKNPTFSHSCKVSLLSCIDYLYIYWISSKGCFPSSTQTAQAKPYEDTTALVINCTHFNNCIVLPKGWNEARTTVDWLIG